MDSPLPRSHQQLIAPWLSVGPLWVPSLSMMQCYQLILLRLLWMIITPLSCQEDSTSHQSSPTSGSKVLSTPFLVFSESHDIEVYDIHGTFNDEQSKITHSLPSDHCASFHWSTPVAGGIISQEGWELHYSIGIKICIYREVWYYYLFYKIIAVKSMSAAAIGSRPGLQFQAWVSSNGAGLISNEGVIGYLIYLHAPNVHVFVFCDKRYCYVGLPWLEVTR